MWLDKKMATQTATDRNATEGQINAANYLLILLLLLLPLAKIAALLALTELIGELCETSLGRSSIDS